MTVFSGLASVLFAAALGGVVAKLLKQPVILGYLVAGAVCSAWGLIEGEMIRILGQIGVTLLLFLVGLELPLTQLKKLGKTAVFTGVGQILITSVLGWGIARLLGFGLMEAIFLGISLTFSSTIVVVKVLSEKGDLNSLHGKIAVGSLLVQDFVAIGILIALSGIGTNLSATSLGILFMKGVGLLVLTFLISEVMMPKIVFWLAGSIELMFIFSLGWCLVVAAFVASAQVGFSVEIGGLLAGLAFANASQHGQIMARVRPLRDFFLTLFFVALGAGIKLSFAGEVIVPAIVFSVYVVIGNPVIMMNILGVMGYKKRTAFSAGITMGQISEFSLVVISAAVAAHQVDSNVLTLVTLVGIITMTISTYVIQHSNRIYQKLGKSLPFLSFNQGRIVNTMEEKDFRTVLFGYGRTGKEILPSLEKIGKTLVIDFDPHVVDELRSKNVGGVFGDMSDVELYEQLGLTGVELIVSTVPDVLDSAQLLSEVKRWKSKPIVVVTGGDEQEANKLYKLGADYVLVPNRVGGKYLASLISDQGSNNRKIVETGLRHKEDLK